jgi:SAM-dependent methyltransferase
VDQDWDRSRREWDERTETFGKRAVFNICHDEKGRNEFTAMQRSILLPILRRNLIGCERTALDFGCGIGRWTPMLAEEIDGYAIGVDPTPALLAFAEERKPPDGVDRNSGVRTTHVEYRLYEGSAIPIADASIDLVWICLVLSAIIADTVLVHTVRELDRVTRPGGLVFLVDNVDGPGYRPVRSRWSNSRPAVDYQRLFAPFVDLINVGGYVDLGEDHAILVGRKWIGVCA